MRTKYLRIPWPEVAILITAAVSFAHLWWVAHGVRLDGGLLSGWFYPSILVHEPSRLLLASVLLLVPLRASRLACPGERLLGRRLITGDLLTGEPQAGGDRSNASYRPPSFSISGRPRRS